jgi:hypothetical protein
MPNPDLAPRIPIDALSRRGCLHGRNAEARSCSGDRDGHDDQADDPDMVA